MGLMPGRLCQFQRRTVISSLTAAALILGGCAARGVLDVSFLPPTTNTDGSPLTDVASYRIYYSTTNPPCPGGQMVAAAAPKKQLPPDQPLGVRLTGLTLGTLYFVAVTAVNSRGLESSCTKTANARARRP